MGALAPDDKIRPVFERTFFVTSVTLERSILFRSAAFAELFLDTLYDYRKQEKYLLHEFVVMPDHIHLIVTPDAHTSLERAMQFIKGGFAYRVGKELRRKGQSWQPGFKNHRIRDGEDYQRHRNYIHMNPVRSGLVKKASDYLYSSANPKFVLDEVPS